jgi:hypothetical protein
MRSSSIGESGSHLFGSSRVKALAAQNALSKKGLDDATGVERSAGAAVVAARAAQVARLRYDNGYTSYIEVLDAERSLFDAALAYWQTHGVLSRR